MNQNFNLGNPNNNMMNMMDNFMMNQNMGMNMIQNYNYQMNMNEMNMNAMNMNMNMNNNNYLNLNNNFNVNNQFHEVEDEEENNINNQFHEVKDEEEKKANNQSQQEVEDEEENVGDIIPICKEEKEKRKEIIFIKSDFSKIRVRIPSYIRKNELYYIAGKFKCIKYSTIKLFHDTEILLNDDTSIDSISDGDYIKINENLDINDFYYKSLFLKHKNTDRFIHVSLHGERRISRKFPEDITIKEMLSAFLMELKIPIYLSNNFRFNFNCKNLHYEDNEKIKDLIYNNFAFIYFYETNHIMGGVFLFGKEGKLININLEIKKGNLCLERIETEIGTLKIIKDLYFSIQSSLKLLYGKENLEIKEIKIIPGNIEIKEDDERTLSLIGVREDFKCEVFL